MVRRRVLFTCAECDASLVWPTEPAAEDDRPTSCLYPIDDGFHSCGVDPVGRSTIVMHPDRMWKMTVDPSGRARCPEGHPVGTVTTGENPPPWFIALWTDKVAPREMRGRV